MVIKKIGFLRSHSAAGPRGLSPFLLKHGGEVLKLELAKLLKSVWAKEEIPKNWCESMIVPVYEEGVDSQVKITKELD